MTFGTVVRNQDRETLGIATGAGGLVLLIVVAFLIAPQFALLPMIGLGCLIVAGWVLAEESTAKVLAFLTTVSTVVILGLITVFLLIQSVPAFQTMGVDILLRTQEPMWSRAAEVYSLAPMIWGTLVTTAIAMTIAGPLGLAGALFISEIAPGWTRELIKPAVEVLAGIPSIVYGWIGFVVINEYMTDAATFDLPTYGSLFVVGIVIGLMALPTVVSVAEDAIGSVPDTMKDGSLALGATAWQTETSVTIPAAFSGISAAVLLGVGRALGETMAATVILGHAQVLPDPLYDVFGNTETLTSIIASQYGIATGIQRSALFAAGVVLFVTVLALSVGAQVVEAHMRHKLGGQP